jgi:hypothetical protein
VNGTAIPGRLYKHVQTGQLHRLLRQPEPLKTEFQEEDLRLVTATVTGFDREGIVTHSWLGTKAEFVKQFVLQ